MSYNIESTEMYKLVLENTYLSLAQGMGEDMMEAICRIYEEDENYEACAAIMVAIENWKGAGSPTNVSTIW
jgi:hypothetical protein